jgi:hypothetical protein
VDAARAPPRLSQGNFHTKRINLFARRPTLSLARSFDSAQQRRKAFSRARTSETETPFTQTAAGTHFLLFVSGFLTIAFCQFYLRCVGMLRKHSLFEAVSTRML